MMLPASSHPALHPARQLACALCLPRCWLTRLRCMGGASFLLFEFTGGLLGGHSVSGASLERIIKFIEGGRVGRPTELSAQVGKGLWKAS